VTCGTPRRLQANGTEFQLHEWGEPGLPPVLLLHSLAAHGHWWDWVAPLLAARHHVVALDFRGHGGSAWVEPYRFVDYVGDVDAVLTSLGWHAALVAGHSMGGYVGALHAAHHPDRVTALVVADMLTGWSEEMGERARAQAERPAAEFASVADVAARFRLAPQETTAPRERLTHLGEAGAAERATGKWSLAFDRRVFLHPPPDPFRFLDDVRAPTLVARGAGSSVMSMDEAEAVAGAVQRGEAAEIPGAFHHLIVDAPEAFAELVLGWESRIQATRE
jgi:pimeloyl-ACP methyl ester carboxylesterase